MMVDNILKDSEEVCGSDDDDLSGDEIKTPIFVITKTQADNAMNRDQNPESHVNEDMEDDEEAFTDKLDELFVQEEYDLAANLDMIVSRIDTFDEFKFFADTARQYHQQNPQIFQDMVKAGLQSEKQQAYLKQIMQSQRVQMQNDQQSQDMVPRRIVKAKRRLNAKAGDMNQI